LRWKRGGYWGVLFSAATNRRACLGPAELEEGGDWWQVRLRLRWSFPDDAGAAFDRAWEEAVDLVAKHWITIRRVMGGQRQLTFTPPPPDAEKSFIYRERHYRQ